MTSACSGFNTDTGLSTQHPQTQLHYAATVLGKSDCLVELANSNNGQAASAQHLVTAPHLDCLTEGMAAALRHLLLLRHRGVHQGCSTQHQASRIAAGVCALQHHRQRRQAKGVWDA